MKNIFAIKLNVIWDRNMAKFITKRGEFPI